ncbi:type III effector protein [Streptomyces sp. WAC06614]|uniref:type III effector protein n=1 Tax=Streptomyces sp. WAC06614 TaxID=2487416 RepID=UPI000F77844A|nr:type III effector protein [Streptomyces sp. WAC06614]RSS60791.1 type III effector protein [Streptomyces sp. WAC06614]
METALPPRAAEDPGAPASFLAAAAALEAIDSAMGRAHGPETDTPDDPQAALATLLLLREVRERLAGWESGLIETARAAGASWADLAGPLGVASRQAAERRYLRLRPGAAGSTGEQRVQAARDRRAAQRSVNAWARDHAADLRQLAGQVAALTDLDAPGRTCVDAVRRALAQDDPADLVAPLIAAEPHVRPGAPALADGIGAMISRTDELRRASDRRRSGT